MTKLSPEAERRVGEVKRAVQNDRHKAFMRSINRKNQRPNAVEARLLANWRDIDLYSFSHGLLGGPISCSLVYSNTLTQLPVAQHVAIVTLVHLGFLDIYGWWDEEIRRNRERIVLKG